MNSWIRVVSVLSIAWLPQSCAYLHSVMLSDVDPRPKSSTPIDVKVSENTVNFEELAAIGKNLGKIDKLKGVGKASDALELYTAFFQWGPRTGTPVFNAYYARVVPDLLQGKCPGGRVTNIVSIRESREYPVVKGEVIRIKALCQHGKGKTS